MFDVSVEPCVDPLVSNGVSVLTLTCQDAIVKLASDKDIVSSVVFDGLLTLSKQTGGSECIEVWECLILEMLEGNCRVNLRNERG